MKNYYEILEVDRNASKEIIEKAYKTLAKKYHPDVQEQNQKKIAEEKMKLIVDTLRFEFIIMYIVLKSITGKQRERL